MKSVTLPALLILVLGSAVCHADTPKADKPQVKYVELNYPDGGRQGIPVAGKGVVAKFRADGTLQSFSQEDDAGHMLREYELAEDGKTVVSGKRYFDNGNFTVHIQYETLKDKSTKETMFGRNGLVDREYFRYPDGKELRLAYQADGKRLLERVSEGNPIVRETWFSNYVQRTKEVITSTETEGKKTTMSVREVYRTDGTLQGTEKIVSEGNRHISHVFDEYYVDGTTLLRRVNMGEVKDKEYFGGYREVPLSVEQYFPNNTVRHRILREDWSVSHEETRDKDGKVLKSKDYTAEEAPREEQARRRQRPEDDKRWWSPRD